MSNFNDQTIAEFRANAGVVGGHFEGKHLLLLHAIGKRSGQERVNPLVYATDDGSFVICGSNGGAEREPQWVANVEAMAEVTVDVGERTLRAKASVVRETAEWDRLHAVFAAYWPDMRQYETRTSRRFPMIRLDPVERLGRQMTLPGTAERSPDG
jgi:deazaflavin-dependent oxidoreductase (nitroreductase family)